LLILVGAALLRALWTDLNAETRTAGLGALGVAWVAAEFAWQRADLFILPTIRTILDIPERIGNWFETVFDWVPFAVRWFVDLLPFLSVDVPGDNPWRWAVLGEMVVLAMVVWTVWFRFVRGPVTAVTEPESDADTDRLVTA
jgi:hypothetical protein